MRSTLTALAAATVALGAGATAAPVPTAPTEVTGTTVVIHGFQLDGTVPDWPFHLAEAIRVRAGGGRIFHYRAATGDLTPCTHPACGVSSTL